MGYSGYAVFGAYHAFAHYFCATTEKTDITMSSDVLAELRERGLIFQVAGEDAIVIALLDAVLAALALLDA